MKIPSQTWSNLTYRPTSIKTFSSITHINHDQTYCWITNSKKIPTITSKRTQTCQDQSIFTKHRSHRKPLNQKASIYLSEFTSFDQRLLFPETIVRPTILERVVRVSFRPISSKSTRSKRPHAHGSFRNQERREPTGASSWTSANPRSGIRVDRIPARALTVAVIKGNHRPLLDRSLAGHARARVHPMERL